MAEAQARVAKNIILPPGYRTAWAGGFEDLQVAKERLEFTVPVEPAANSLSCSYSLFNNMRDTLPSLVGIPAGGDWRHLGAMGHRQPFSVSAAIGFVSLFGVSVVMTGFSCSLFTTTPGNAVWKRRRRCTTRLPAGCGRC